MEKKLFRSSRHSLTNENLKLSDDWLVTDTSKEKLAIKSTATNDYAKSKKFIDSIRISNLPESMVLADLKFLGKIGPLQKTYIKCNRQTGLCEGFAYVTFKHRQDAVKAIQLLNGLPFDNVILKAEWAQPQTK